MGLPVWFQVLGLVGTALTGAIASWKVIRDLIGQGRTSLRDEYRFAKEFFDAVGKPGLHPLAYDLGHKAIAGDAQIGAEEVAYLLSLPQPRAAIRTYIVARTLLQFHQTAVDSKISFKRSNGNPSRRRVKRGLFAVGYFATYMLGFSPIFLLLLDLLSGQMALGLFIVSAPTFFPTAFLCLRAATRIHRGEELLAMQSGRPAPGPLQLVR